MHGIKNNFMWLSFLKELVKRQVITDEEKDLIIAEYDCECFHFKNISKEERGQLLADLKTYLGIEIERLKEKIEKIQEEAFVEPQNNRFRGTWLSVDSYAEKNRRAVVALIHAIMGTYLKI